MRLPDRLRSAWWRRRHVLLPALLLVALWLPGADQGWYRTDTHFYAAIAKGAWDRAIAERSASPLLDLAAGSEPYFNKPPLAFVVHGLFQRVLGTSVWTVRLPSLLAAVLAAGLAAAAVRRLGGWRLALASGLALATTLEFFRYTRAISLDLWMVMLLCWALAVAGGAVRLMDRNDRRGVLRMALAGVPLGLALLTKPLMALGAVPVLALWLAFGGRARRAWTPLLAGAVAVLVAAPWHAWMMARHPDFALVYFKQQSLDRAVSGHEGRAGAEPCWYYARIIAESYWPWLATLAAGLVMLARARPRPGPRVRDALLLAGLWTGLWLAALSAFGGKAPRYTVVLWPLASVLATWWLARPAAGVPKRLGRLVLDALGPAAVAGGAAMALAGIRVHEPRNPAWDRLVQRLDASPGSTVVTTPRAHPAAANLVMLGRPWPPVARGQPAARPGLLLIAHPDEPPPTGGREIDRTDAFALYAVEPPPPGP